MLRKRLSMCVAGVGIVLVSGCIQPVFCDGVLCLGGQTCVDGNCVDLKAMTLKSTPCSEIAIACFDELARQPADAIRFRPISRWPRTALTWRMKNLLPNLNQTKQISAAAEAFSRWAIVSKLIFKQVDSNADITISFEKGNHGDVFNFDGPGGNLGHAFFPSTLRAGQIHLDFEETWALTPSATQKDLFTVLLHDIGHVLGLDHSLIKTAVMAPEYPVEGLSILTEEDIAEIRRLYGSEDGDVDPVPDTRNQCGIPPNLTELNDPDSDGDGIPDTLEVFVFDTDPLDIDTDGDGVNDYQELFIDCTLPTCAGDDHDNDGLPDACEALEGTDPNLADSDGDGLLDGSEVFFGTDPTNSDTDGDGCGDGIDLFPNTPSIGLTDCMTCTSDQDCHDELFCNGTESCHEGLCVPGSDPCDDSVGCTDDSCDENNDMCTNTINDANCDDGLFCNGTETCDPSLSCQDGINPCDDSVDCTDDSCDENNDMCTNTINDANCDDGLFCNGTETCDPSLSCQAGINPCDDNEVCDEFEEQCLTWVLYVSNRGISNQGGVSAFNGLNGKPMLPIAPSGHGGLLFANGITISPHTDNLIVASVGTGSIKEYSRSHNVCEDNYQGDFTSSTVVSSGISFGPDGDLYATDYTPGQILRFDGQTGALDTSFQTDTCETLKLPGGLLFFDSGDLLVGTQNDPSIILQVDSMLGGSCSVFASGCNLEVLVGMTLHPSSGAILVSNFSRNSVVEIDAATGDCLGDFIAPGVGGLEKPQGIVVGPTGNIFVSSQGTNSILEYDLNGVPVDSDLDTSEVDAFVEDGGLEQPTYLLFALTIVDCNGNGTLDARDIRTGRSFDLNSNGMPDECEIDFDGNGVVDLCEQ